MPVYPGVSVIVPVADGDSLPSPVPPAVLSARRQQYPGPLEVIVVTSDPPCRGPAEDLPGATDKVRKLHAGVKKARHPILAFWDADVQAPPGLLARLVRTLDQPGAGLVYALPCWTGAATLPGLLLQAWANAQVGTFLIPIARSARRQPVTGALVVIHRRTLDQVGGTAALAGYLADDARLGELVQAAGYRAVPCGWVKVGGGRRGWGETLSTFLRWLVTLRHHTPRAYALSCLLHPVAAALLWGLWMQHRGMALGPAWGPLLAAALLRVAAASLPVRLAGARDFSVAALAPVADLLAAVLWPAPLFVRRLTWGGCTYSILGGGRVAKRNELRGRQ